MALVPCTECGQSVSEQARTCPGCGAPTREGAALTAQRQWVYVPLLILAGLAVAFLLLEALA